MWIHWMSAIGIKHNFVFNFEPDRRSVHNNSIDKLNFVLLNIRSLCLQINLSTYSEYSLG